MTQPSREVSLYFPIKMEKVNTLVDNQFTRFTVVGVKEDWSARGSRATSNRVFDEWVFSSNRSCVILTIAQVKIVNVYEVTF